MTAVYIANEGIKYRQKSMEMSLQNLANGSTRGYLADVPQATTTPIVGEGYPTQFPVVLKNVLVDMTAGALEKTGRDLDIAVENDGLIALQGDKGEGEVYTKNGHMQRASNGQLTIKGWPVVGEGGAVFLPERYESLVVTSNGTITVTVNRNLENIGRIKLVDIPKAQLRTLHKNDNGLLVAESRSLPRSENIRVVQGYLANSNVSPIQETMAVTSAKNDSAVMTNVMKSVFEMDQMGNKVLEN